MLGLFCHLVLKQWEFHTSWKHRRPYPWQVPLAFLIPTLWKQPGRPHIQFNSVTQLCLTLWPHGLQHTRLPCPSPTPGACSNSCPSMPSNHLILFHPLLLLPSVFPSIRVFSNESVLRIRSPKYWSFSFSIHPSNEYSGLISFGIDWFPLGLTGFISLQSKGLSRAFSNTTV